MAGGLKVGQDQIMPKTVFVLTSKTGGFEPDPRIGGYCRRRGKGKEAGQGPAKAGKPKAAATAPAGG